MQDNPLLGMYLFMLLLVMNSFVCLKMISCRFILIMHYENVYCIYIVHGLLYIHFFYNSR